MVRNGEIIGTPSKSIKLADATLSFPPAQNGEQDALPSIDPATASKKELVAWLTKATGKEPGPATKEETLRARVVDLLAALVPKADDDTGDNQNQGATPSEGKDQNPPSRLSETVTSGTATSEPNIETKA